MAPKWDDRLAAVGAGAHHRPLRGMDRCHPHWGPPPQPINYFGFDEQPVWDTGYNQWGFWFLGYLDSAPDLTH